MPGSARALLALNGRTGQKIQSTWPGRLRTQSAKHIWMMGGGEIVASLLDEEEIDEFSISVIPIFIGEGIPLIPAPSFGCR